MSNYARDFSDVTITNGSSTLQINSNDSNFAIAPGSRLFLNGFLPVTVTAGDTINRTLTLAAQWPHADQINVQAALIPIGLGDWLLQALDNNRAAYEAFVATIEGQEDPLTEVKWSDIVAATLPEFVKRWAKYSEIADKPDYAQGWPSFENVTGTVAREQLPESIETDSKRTQALSPPVEPESPLHHKLKDYPTLKSTDELPTDSPNNRRLIRFDDVRGLVHVALTEEWFTVPTTVNSRKFMVLRRGRYIQLNSAFDGFITLRVFPMGSGGLGLPSAPTLANNQWHTITVEVASLWTIGRFDSEYFEGIIDYVEMLDDNGIENNWELLDTDKSKFTSLNGWFKNDFGLPESPFQTFYLRSDDYWYSEDLTPNTPYSIGASWAQDPDDFRTYTVSDASGNSDALRFFNDNYDDYEFELILVSDIDRTMAITSSNQPPNLLYYPGVNRFITDSRINFKRNNGSVAISGTLTVESLRMRVPKHG